MSSRVSPSFLVSTLALFVLAAPSAFSKKADNDPERLREAFSERSTEFRSRNGLTESCQLLPRFPFLPSDITVTEFGGSRERTFFRDEDFTDALNLCEIDFNAESGPNSYGVCPKLHNTQPALEIYDLDKGDTKTTWEAKWCDRSGSGGKRDGDKIAKFKQGVYGYQSQSILLFFHLSRLLGNVALAPVATYRTMAVSDMKSYITDGLADGVNKSIRAGWRILSQRLNMEGKKAATDAKAIVPGDSSMLYGALSDNPRGEDDCNFFRGSSMLGSSYSRLITNPNISASDFLANMPRGQALQLLLNASDVSAAVVLDNIMEQADRNGNTHMRAYFHYISQEDNRLHYKKMTKPEREALRKLRNRKTDLITARDIYAIAGPNKDHDAAPDSAVVLNRLMFKDNDDGLSGVKKFSTSVDAIRHFNPLVYARLQWLARLATNPETEPQVRIYFQSRLHVTKNVYEKVFKGVIASADKLKSQFEAGNLRLDLDLEDYLRRTK